MEHACRNGKSFREGQLVLGKQRPAELWSILNIFANDGGGAAYLLCLQRKRRGIDRQIVGDITGKACLKSLVLRQPIKDEEIRWISIRRRAVDLEISQRQQQPGLQLKLETGLVLFAGRGR